VLAVIMTKSPRPIITVSIKTNRKLRTSDELIAADFLKGFCRPTTGLLHREYFEPGSDLEREGRRAFLRVIRSEEPLSRAIREYLADLFDPDGADDRHAIIELRNKKQKVSRSPAGAQVAKYVDQLSKTKGPVKTAESAADYFGVSRKRIYELLRIERQRRKKKSPAVTPKRELG
jgi:hypothetical protein